MALSIPPDCFTLRPMVSGLGCLPVVYVDGLAEAKFSNIYGGTTIGGFFQTAGFILTEKESLASRTNLSRLLVESVRQSGFPRTADFFAEKLSELKHLVPFGITSGLYLKHRDTITELVQQDLPETGKIQAKMSLSMQCRMTSHIGWYFKVPSVEYDYAIHKYAQLMSKNAHNELEETRTRLTETTGELEETRTRLGETTVALVNTLTSLEETTGELMAARTSLVSAHTRLGETTDELAGVRTELDQVQSKLTKLGKTSEELGDTRAKLKDTHIRFEKLKERLNQMEQNLKAMAELNTRLSKELTSLKISEFASTHFLQGISEN